jgi:spermidine synthase
MSFPAGNPPPRIERVTRATAGPYRPLLSGYHRPLLARLSGTPDDEVVAIGARVDERPCGLLLCRRFASGPIARMEALRVLPSGDERALFSRMLSEAEGALASAGCEQLRIEAEQRAAPGLFLPEVLSSRGYRASDLLCIAAELSTGADGPWSRESAFPSGCEVVAWSDLTDDERRRILARQARAPDFDDLPVLPSSSVALRSEGRLCGWSLTHRSNASFVRSQGLWVSPEFAESDVDWALLIESVRRQLATAEAPAGWYGELPLHDVARVEQLGQRLLPFARRHTELHKRKYVRDLGAAASDHGTFLEPQDESMLWKHVVTQRSPFQRIAMKRDHLGFYLELDGHMQFHSSEEYRYHEAMVHPPMLVSGAPRNVLILGGGDGLALREVLRYPTVERALLIDIDEAVTDLARRFEPLAELNEHAFEDPRVEVLNEDAHGWLAQEPREVFDVVLIDFPDPNTDQLARLYARESFERLERHMGPRSALSIQCSSISRWPRTFWCTARTVEAAGFSIVPYSVEMPLFGMWGFVCAAVRPFAWPTEAPKDLRFLDDAALRALPAIGKDRAAREVRINAEGDLQLARYHAQDLAAPWPRAPLTR